MKKLTLFACALLIAGGAMAHDGKKGCCSNKGKECKKEASKDGKACCHKKGGETKEKEEKKN